MSAGSARGTEWEKVRKQVLERDGYVCNYCGRDANTADHVLPRAKGGTNELSNLVAACGDCNSSKQDKVDRRTNWFNKNWLTNL